MRWVDRGLAPAGVSHYASTYTHLWVQYFQQQVGARPNQHNYWTVFVTDLRERFNAKCGYCERRFEAVGELSSSVDHFRPLNRFPHLAYEWANWVSSCKRCNFGKADKWASTGYVDPCTTELMERPEEYFDYVPLTGEIVAKSGLTRDARRKAEDTIADLGLNETRLRESRFRQIRVFIEEFYLQEPGPARLDIVSEHQEPSIPHVGVVKMFVEQLRRVEII